MWYKRTLMLTMIVVLISGAWADDAEDVLWRVYTQGSETKRRVLAESQRRIRRLRNKADKLVKDDEVYRDRDFAWLLEHRIPAGLVIERELRGIPEGHYLKVLLQLGLRIGNERILSHLPVLLRKTRSMASKRTIIHTMAAIRNDRYVESLRNYLREATPETPPKLVVEAALGLSQARNKGDLELLKASEDLLSNPAARVNMLVARHRCGDETVEGLMVGFVKDPPTPVQLRLRLISYLADEPFNEGVLALGHLAKGADNRRVAEAALGALFVVRRRLKEPRLGVPVEAEKDKPSTPMMPWSLREARQQSDDNLSQDDIETIAERIVEMWLTRDTNPTIEKKLGQETTSPPLQ